ncbi:MAG: hypothetical protein ACRDRS_26165 [Pseudonocardiaceae bacterium]
MSTRDSAIVRDPHGADSCVVTLDEAAATFLFDLLGEQLRTSAPLPEGSVHPLAEPYPGYGATSDVRRITSTLPQPFLDRLAETVEQLGATRSLLRQIIALADDSATLSNGELRDRLTTLTQTCARVRVLATTSEDGLMTGQ